MGFQKIASFRDTEPANFQKIALVGLKRMLDSLVRRIVALASVCSLQVAESDVEISAARISPEIPLYFPYSEEG